MSTVPIVGDDSQRAMPVLVDPSIVYQSTAGPIDYAVEVQQEEGG